MSSNAPRKGCVAIPAVAAASLFSRPTGKSKHEWMSWADRRNDNSSADAPETPPVQATPSSALETRRA